MSHHSEAKEFPRSATAQANTAWESLLQAHSVLMKGFAAENIWHEVSMREYDVLYSLSKCHNTRDHTCSGVRLSELQQQVLLSQPALSRMVDRLVDRGLLTREVDPHDRRGVLISLTAEGIQAQRKTGRSHGKSVAEAVNKALTSSEQEQLYQLCSKLAANQ